AVLRAGERPAWTFWLACSGGAVCVLLFAWTQGAGGVSPWDLVVLAAGALAGLAVAGGGGVHGEVGAGPAVAVGAGRVGPPPGGACGPGRTASRRGWARGVARLRVRVAREHVPRHVRLVSGAGRRRDGPHRAAAAGAARPHARVVRDPAWRDRRRADRHGRPRGHRERRRHTACALRPGLALSG